MRNSDTQLSIANKTDISWKDVRPKRVSALTSGWQDGIVTNYHTINRILLLCVGLWPYQKSSSRNIIIAFITVMLISSVVFQLTVFITTEYNVDLLLHILAYSIPWLAYTLKYNVLCLNVKKMRYLMEQLRCDWYELNKAPEIEIIKRYSAIGKFITLITTLFIYLSICSFFLIQLLSSFFPGVVITVNKSYMQQFPIMVEYFIDQEKYCIPLLLHLFLVIVCGFTTVVATETLLMLYVQHTCGLFEIASYRIEQALQKDTVQGIASIAEKDLIIRQGIISAINMFIQTSKANFKWGYTFLLPLGVISLSINLYRLSQLVRTNEYNEMIFSFSFILGHFWYMFFCNYLGQEVIDHSTDIFHRTYNTQWYTAPLKSQKLLLLLMQRSMRHYTLIIGGLFVPSLEGFATLTSFSASYFMMIFSTL